MNGRVQDNLFFAGSWTDVGWISNKDACLTTCFSIRLPWQVPRSLPDLISGHARDFTKLPMRDPSSESSSRCPIGVQPAKSGHLQSHPRGSADCSAQDGFTLSHALGWERPIDIDTEVSHSRPATAITSTSCHVLTRTLSDSRTHVVNYHRERN